MKTKNPTVDKFAQLCKQAIAARKTSLQAALVNDKRIENLRHNLRLAGEFGGRCKALYDAYQREVSK